MRKIPSLDIVLLQSSIFGVNQGFTGKYILPSIAWALGISNLCYSLTTMYLTINGQYFRIDENSPVSYVSRAIYWYLAMTIIVIFQIRFLCRRRKMAPIGQDLYRLYQLSTWNGDICACLIRVFLFLGAIINHQSTDQFASERFRILIILHYWASFVPTVVGEFVDQAMLLLRHELEVLCKITSVYAKRRDYGMEELRVLNRRHASLSTMFNAVARITGTDSLLAIESERILLLIIIFIQVNYLMAVPADSKNRIINVVLYIFRIERITHYCLRGHRLIVEADRFVTLLDEVNPLDLKNEESFTEFQIFRKQARLRKMQFDCNHFLKLDMKLIFQISKDLLTLIIILIQLTTDPTIELSTSANATQTDNVTEYYHGFWNTQLNSTIPVNN